ncbi:hypothetical protein [Parasphingorhabdus pacifica]
MGARRNTALLISAMAAATVAAVPVAQAEPPAPLQVKLGEVSCKDLSGLAEALPPMSAFVEDPSNTATVHVAMRADNAERSVPYEVTVDGEIRSKGYVGVGGRVISDVIVPNSSNTHVQVRSRGEVLAERMYRTRC